MWNFTIKIEQGGQEYDGENFAWTKKFEEDILRIAALTDSELHTYAEEIKDSILRNYFTSTTFRGDPVFRLSPSWAEAKGHGKVFFHTGLLYRSLILQKVSDGYEIFFAEARAQIAYWLQFGTKKMPPRPAFGIMPERADVILNSLLTGFHYQKNAA